MQLLVSSTKQKVKCIKVLNIGHPVLNPTRKGVNKHGVILHFSGKHDNCYTALKYVIKIDK